MDSVFLILDSKGVVYEVCSSFSVAEKHLSCGCYDVLRGVGADFSISERKIWSD